MNAEDFRKLLEETDDKLSVYSKAETLNSYTFKKSEFFGIISDFLSDEEKLKLFDFSHFKNLKKDMKLGIIGTVSDENVILQMISNDDIIKDLENYDVVNIIKKISDSGKEKLLHNSELIEKCNISYSQLKDIILSLSDKAVLELLTDVNLTKDKLNLNTSQIADITSKLSSDETKDKILKAHKFGNSEKIDILRTCSNDYKLTILINDKSFKKDDIIDILKTLDARQPNSLFTK